MQLLLSNYKPAKYDYPKDSRKTFEDLLKKSDIVNIATGFVSADSLVELKKIVEINRKPHINLLIGMHYFDGFTRNQLNAALDLNKFLIESNLGFVNVSNTLKFHGKLYSFVNDNFVQGCIVGSSNLSSFFGREKLYEADFLISEKNEANKIDEYISKLIYDLGSRIDKLDNFTIIEEKSLLEDQEGVEKLGQNEVRKLFFNKRSFLFEIPIKTEPKSNLNIFFGKGREDSRGFIIPRPWYEAELIVSKSITTLHGFPFLKTFEVITDDGFKFRCNTNGDFSKNFRSNDDLQILGKWLKGRLQNFGALEIGKPVTESTLTKYGRNHMTLISTNNPNIWLLDFSNHVS